jgi:hypothetical protein
MRIESLALFVAVAGILFVAVASILAGCDAPNAAYYEIVKIDGCQYIHTHTYREHYLTHKSDCNNPIHGTGARAEN